MKQFEKLKLIRKALTAQREALMCIQAARPADNGKSVLLARQLVDMLEYHEILIENERKRWEQ